MKYNEHKHDRVDSSWRRPRGRHNKQRLNKKEAPTPPGLGQKKPEEVRGLHPSGMEEVLVHNPGDLEGLEEGQAARIASKVGERKREMIVEKAEETDTVLLNE